MSVGTVVGDSERGSSRDVALPRGLTVALLGPDGSGKTTVAKTLSADPDTCRIYMGSNAQARDRTLPTTRWIERTKTTLSQRSARGGPLAPVFRVAHSLVKAVGFGDRLLDRWYRYTLARYRRRSGQVVIFDRYVLDPRVGDGHSSPRARTRAWLLRAGAPKPDLTLLLDAPVDVLRSRKNEQTRDRLERLRTAYLALPGQHPEIEVVDVSRDLDTVLDDIRGRIRRRRTAA